MAAKKTPVFDFKRCVSCSVCVQACPVSCIALSQRGGGSDKNLYPAVGGGCLGCAACQRACPVNAIEMEERPDAH